MSESWERAETPTKSGLMSDHKGPVLTVCRWMDNAAVVLTEAQCGCGPSAGSVSYSPLTVWALSGVCVGQPTHCIGSACSRCWPVHLPSLQSSSDTADSISQYNFGILLLLIAGSCDVIMTC